MSRSSQSSWPRRALLDQPLAPLTGRPLFCRRLLSLTTVNGLRPLTEKLISGFSKVQGVRRLQLLVIGGARESLASIPVMTHS